MAADNELDSGAVGETRSPVRARFWRAMSAMTRSFPGGWTRPSFATDAGVRIPLVGPSGIWKPAACELPISIAMVTVGPSADSFDSRRGTIRLPCDHRRAPSSSCPRSVASGTECAHQGKGSRLCRCDQVRGDQASQGSLHRRGGEGPLDAAHHALRPPEVERSRHPERVATQQSGADGQPFADHTCTDLDPP